MKEDKKENGEKEEKGENRINRGVDEITEEGESIRNLLLILSVFLFFIIFLTWALFYIQKNYTIEVTCNTRIPFGLFIAIVISVSVASGAIVSLFYLLGLRKKRELIRRDALITLKFLDKDEALIIKELIKNNGESLQSKLVKQTGLTRVRVTRALKKLEEKGVIKRKRMGKENKVLLLQELKELFSCEVCNP